MMDQTTRFSGRMDTASLSNGGSGFLEHDHQRIRNVQIEVQLPRKSSRSLSSRHPEHSVVKLPAWWHQTQRRSHAVSISFHSWGGGRRHLAGYQED